MVKRFEIYLVTLDLTRGREIQKTRPCMIVSPNEMHVLDTVIVLPMTTKSKPYPMRVPILFQEKPGFLVLDQIRTIDKSRLSKYLGTADPMTGMRALQVLREMFDV